MAACDICLELFTSAERIPRILQCGHTVCEVCLFDLAIYSPEGEVLPTSQCPYCRSVLTQRLQDWPKNFALLQMEHVNSSLCPLHADLQQQIILFWAQCDTPVCTLWVTGSHNGHQFVQVKDRVLDMKQAVSKMIDLSKAQRSRQEELMQRYSERISDYEAQREESILEIHAVFDAQIQILEAKRAETIEKLASRYEHDLSKIKGVFWLSEKRFHAVESFISDLQNFENQFSDEQQSLQLVQQLQDYETRCQKISYNFYPEAKLHRFWLNHTDIDLDKFGVIDTEPIDCEIVVFDSRVWKFNALTWEWRELLIPDLPFFEYSAGCCVPHTRGVVITGGWNMGKSVQAANIVYPDLGKWDTRGNMAIGRFGHVQLFYNEMVIVMGGFNDIEGSSGIASWESYDVYVDKWENFPQMNFPRKMFSGVVHARQIFVAGGHWNGYLTTMEVYNFYAWSLLEVNLPNGLAGCVLFSYNNEILVLGGWNADVSFSQAYSLNDSDLVLSHLPDMLASRAFHKAFAYKGAVYVVGGNKEKEIGIEKFCDDAWWPIEQSTMFPIEVEHNLEVSSFAVLI